MRRDCKSKFTHDGNNVETVMQQYFFVVVKLNNQILNLQINKKLTKQIGNVQNIYVKL